MKQARLKKRNLLGQVVMCGLCVGMGYYLRMTLSPDYSAMMQTRQDPFVSVQGLSRKDVSHKKKFIAEVEAINSVEIIPQIAGYLEEVRFKDGAFVNEGEVLFVIEQEKFKVAVQTAEADLERAKSDLITMENEFKRQQQLFKDKFISTSGLEDAENKLNQASAFLKQAQANLTLAQINLGYTEIKAPISGYIGKVLVSKGNYVSPAVPSLARIVQTDPIRIGFSVSDKERLTFLNNLDTNTENVRFEIAYPDGTTEEVAVENIFSGNEMNPLTATIPVYIDYKNPNKKLLPGNYVDILVTVGDKKEVLVVPLVALAQDVNGTYAMVVGENNIVSQRYLELGQMTGDVREVKDGLSETDKVIVQGLQKVQAGSKVKPIFVKE